MKTNSALIVSAILAFAATASAQSKPARAAVVNGQDITLDQVNKAAAAELQGIETKRLQNDLALSREKQEILTKALEAIVADKLIDLEAAKSKMTKEELLKAEVDSNVETPSTAEIDSFYETYKERIPIPKAEALPQVRQYLIDQSRNRFRQNLIDRLKKQYAFRSFLEPLRTEIATAGFPSRGPAAAPVTIVEFSDFECPFCGGLFPTMKQVENNYPDTVRVVYRQFPLTNIHPHAQRPRKLRCAPTIRRSFGSSTTPCSANKAS